MKRRMFFTAAGLAGLTGISAVSCSKKSNKEDAQKKQKLFSFIHFSDIHLQMELGAHEGFIKAIETMNALSPDFAISGGDLVFDALGVEEDRASALFNLYRESCRHFDMPVYNIIGNHEMFGLYVPEKVPETHPDWGKGLYKRLLGEGSTYRSFDHKGVHFLLLDSMGIEKNTDKPGYEYYGEIGHEQLAWLDRDLAAVPVDVPVIGVSHIPIFTLYDRIVKGPFIQTGRTWVLSDGRELMNLLGNRRFFGYLQGHIHVNELYVYKGTKYVDTAAVSGAWWKGINDGHPEGFNLVDVYEDEIVATYKTYGWDASKYAAVKPKTEMYSFTVGTNV